MDATHHIRSGETAILQFSAARRILTSVLCWVIVFALRGVACEISKLEHCVRFLMVLQLFFVFLSTMSIFF
jgi:hypothetical protein